MLCLRVDGTVEEICATEISRIFSNSTGTHLVLKDGRKISVDEKEENLKDSVKFELLKCNTSESRIKLHLYYSNTIESYHPICIPISCIMSVARSYHSYNMNLDGKLALHIPQNAREKDTNRQQPAIISLKQPIKDGRGDWVKDIIVYESAEYIMSFIETVN